jgi:hypothetical protein
MIDSLAVKNLKIVLHAILGTKIKTPIILKNEGT